MTKIQVHGRDFVPFQEKFPVGEFDSKGEPLYLGDVVEYNNEKYMIVYRYGNFHLKTPMTIHTLGTDLTKVTKLPEVWSIPDLIVAGESEEAYLTEHAELATIGK